MSNPPSKLLLQHHQFLYSTATNPRFVAALYKANLKNKISQQGLFESKLEQNKQTREQMKQIANRYAEGFEILRKESQQEVLFKNIDYIVNIAGFMLNTSGFLSTIELLGDSNQVSHWRNQVLSGQVIGAYTQTEIGHGSNLKGLQATAHYDVEQGVFILNSPNVTSTKYWPGLLGIFSTHTILMATTCIGKTNIGMQAFVIQIRDRNLDNIKGVEAGDIGPKLGFEKVDNGYLKLTNLKVSRDAMLSKYIQISDQGKVIGAENKQAIKYAYGSMLNLRVTLVNGFAVANIHLPTAEQYHLLQRIAPENKSQNQKFAILNCCKAAGILLANKETNRIYLGFKAELANKNFQKADKLLAEAHIVSSTFKALSSWMAIKQCANLASKNIYSSFNSTSLPRYFKDIIPAATYQGDNSVLLQQTAKYLLVSADSATSDNYLPKILQFQDSEIDSVIKVLKYIVQQQVKKLKDNMSESAANGEAFKVIWNYKYQRRILDVAILWGQMKLLDNLYATLNSLTLNKAFYLKISQVFCSHIANSCPLIGFYGVRLRASNAWELFSEQEIQALTDLGMPIRQEPNQTRVEVKECLLECPRL